MRSSFLIILLICIAFSKSENDIILSNMSNEKNWIYKYETSDNISVYKLNNDSFPIIKLSKELDDSYSNIFQTILSIEKYDSIISNKSFSTKQINKNNNSDTVYVYQKITNIIPFIKNRQIIFKLFKSSDNRLSWKLLKGSDNLFEEFSNRSIKTLDSGAGSWEIIDDKLIHYYYVDPKLNLPDFIINRAAEKSVINIFKDVLKFSQSN